LSRGNRSEQGRERTEEERERAREERARRRASERGEPALPPSEPPEPWEHRPEDPGSDPPSGDLPEAVHEALRALPAEAVPELPAPGAADEEAGMYVEDTPAEPLNDPGAELPAERHVALAEEPSHAGTEEPSHAGTEERPHAGTEGLAHATEELPRAATEEPAPYVSADAGAERAGRTGTPLPAGMPAGAGVGPLPPLPPLPPRLAPRAPGGPGRRGRRRVIARGGALVALVAAAVALWLVVHPLLRSGHSKTVTTPAAVKVLIPEGKTRLQIAQLAVADGLVGSYRAASRRSSLLNPAHFGAPANTPDLEGFLFPDTYDIDRGAPVGELVDAQLTDFLSRFGASQIAAARALHVTPYQLLTVASMVEREALIAADRPRIAAVIYNRLSQGMPLGIDATIYYAVELKSGIATYTHELTEAQLHIDSPYNTRLHTGLPPTPISNPGLASIEAAAHPAHVPYLYYVAGADGCGEQVFSTTQAQFEVNAAAYHAAVARNGGHPPPCRTK